MFEAGRKLDWRLDPLEALGRWPADRRVALLHSGRHHPRWARYSVLAEPAGTFRFTCDEAGVGKSEWLGDAEVLAPALAHRPFADLRRLQQWARGGLWLGYLSYDLGRFAERLAAHRNVDRQFPIIELQYCRNYLVYDLAGRTWRAVGDWRDLPDLPAMPVLQGTFAAGAPRGQQTRQQYEAAVRRALAYIAAGDIFQVNLTQRFTAQYQATYPLGQRALYARLARVSPAWYGAYLELAFDPRLDAPRRVVASTSPELFLELTPDGTVYTRPIKGTRPATVDPAQLLHSEKDAAELHMIVDLLRNDLGRVCDYGSVRVIEPRTIESHPTVHHGVATVTGKLHGRKDLIDLLRAAMPGGSITGAPKIRAMQIIDELEPVARGPYCGCVGYFGPDRACFNIAIRTMLLEQTAARAGRVDYSVGGGIVADSVAHMEYQETLDKAAAMLAALGGETAALQCDTAAFGA